MLIKEAIKWGCAALTKTSDAPELDADRILLHVLRQSEGSWLLLNPDHELTLAKQSLFESLIAQRQKGVPLAYLLNEQEFYGHAFKVTPDVLIPRPATEELVTNALAAIKDLYARAQRPLVIADIGTGSGCIAITLALETPTNSIDTLYATDISDTALTVAKQNATTHGVSEQITWQQGNLLEPLRDIPLDLIVSNPPYIPSTEINKSIASPTPETAGLKFEPRQALDGGLDGQQYIKQLVATGIPIIIERTGGLITRYNWPQKIKSPLTL